MENEKVMIKEELFKKVSECQRLLNKIEDLMNSSPENQQKYESTWGKVYSFQKGYISAINNIDELEKISKDIYNEKSNEIVNEVSEEKEEPVIENEETPTETVIEEPVTEVAETPAETVIEEPVAEVEETPAETVIEEPVAEVEETPAETVIEEPVAEVEETPAETVVEEPVTEVAETPAETVIEEPVVEVTETPINEIKVDNLSSIPTPGKKIIVNEKQNQKLLESQETNGIKFNEAFNKGEETAEKVTVPPLQPTVEPIVSDNYEQQMSDMLSKQTEAYNSGDIEKAEEISNEISVLTKKISETVA